ncbi:MAG: RNA polymerase sigma factor [Anaerolineae bacterium]|nr:RNA polymerase sigma factor [Anaerolineae bacterium]
MSTNFDDWLNSKQIDDPALMNTVVLEYYDHIYRLACSILGDGQDAADVVQETFITVRNHLKGYRVGTNFKAWISTIAVNHARMALRRQKSRQNLHDEMKALIEPGDGYLSPEVSVLRNERDHQLWTAVSGLKEKHRFPIILRYVHSFPIREIAQILGIKEGTVHSRLHYAIRKLELQLKDELPDRKKENLP